MKKKYPRFGRGFKVLMGTRRGQVAQLALAPGEVEGGPYNQHAGADQWLYVISGRGTALIEGKPHALRAGALLLIERGERHQIRNTGRTLLKTLNFYAPPAYTSSGRALPRARPRGR